jgi:hypothetical protein
VSLGIFRTVVVVVVVISGNIRVYRV